MLTRKHLTGHFNSLLKRRRDPRYIFVVIGSALVFLLCYLQVRDKGLFDSFERPVLGFFNDLPSGLYELMYAITQLGGLGSLIIWLALAWYLINKRAAATLLGTGLVAWFLAKVAKAIAHRGRPSDILENINLFNGEVLGGFGFPSGHATFSAACATVLYYQIAPKYRKYLLIAVFMVGISRMYLGAHFPLDIVGGWALGALIGGSASLIFGISSKSISVIKLKKFLNTKGLNIQHLTFAEVDARGSRPISITTYDGKEYFGKIFGKQEHAADWLFKIFRFFRYKNLQAEEPHFNSRRNVEIEAFAMLWAKQAGVRVANVTNIQKYGSYWLLIQEKINAIPLSEHGHILQKSLVDTWVQVKKLHTANIAHRDLRASNIMIDKKGRALIIDYGFTEISASAKRQHMDNAELLMSMSLVVGVDRTVAAAKKGIGKKQLALALPYLQTAVFSGPTTKLLKGNKGLLADLKNRITDELDIKEEVDEANILRINRRKAINLVLLAIFVYVVAPQFGVFKDSVATTEIKEPLWLLPLAISSISTYFFTGIIYSALAPVPLKIRDSSLVQLAASFVSKVLPGGLGSTTLNAKYMVKAGMDAIETSTVISAQALIGFIMFIVPLSLLLALNGANILKLVHIDVNPKVAIIVALSGAMGAATVLILPKFRTIAVSKLTSALESIRNISVAPRELTVASIASLAVTAAYVFCLYAALQSVGANIGISTAIIVYATAIIAKSAVPTPGGLGPVEAAMIATLITFGLDKGSAVSAVLIYRLGTFWIPIPLSLLAYRIIGRLKLI